MSEPTYPTPDVAILALEKPLRALSSMLARDEVAAILRECLDDVYEDDGNE